jgi:hypothetical protein
VDAPHPLSDLSEPEGEKPTFWSAPEVAIAVAVLAVFGLGVEVTDDVVVLVVGVEPPVVEADA